MGTHCDLRLLLPCSTFGRCSSLQRELLGHERIILRLLALDYWFDGCRIHTLIHNHESRPNFQLVQASTIYLDCDLLWSLDGPDCSACLLDEPVCCEKPLSPWISRPANLDRSGIFPDTLPDLLVRCARLACVQYTSLVIPRAICICETLWWDVS